MEFERRARTGQAHGEFCSYAYRRTTGIRRAIGAERHPPDVRSEQFKTIPVFSRKNEVRHAFTPYSNGARQPQQDDSKNWQPYEDREHGESPRQRVHVTGFYDEFVRIATRP
jgi:hypothetical protein